MSIILLRGFSNSGKDFVGEILCRDYGYTRFAFADSLKKIVANNFGCNIEQLHSQIGKLQICDNDLKKRTYRQILIDEALRLRNINSDIFANHCCEDIHSDIDKIVITDWRYPNELNVIQNKFPNHRIIPVHIIRQGQLNSPVTDISEHQLDYRTSDYQIVNNMDNSIYNEIKSLFEYIYFIETLKEIDDLNYIDYS
jgi:hypothetical protein